MIEKEQIQLMKGQLKKILKNNYDYAHEDAVNYLVEENLKQKASFIEKFGGKFIYESEELSAGSFGNNFRDLFVDFKNQLFSQYNTTGLFTEIIEVQKETKTPVLDLVYSFIRDNVMQDGFIDNKVVEATTVSDVYGRAGYPLPADFKDSKINVGMKFSRALKFFVPDEALLAKIQNEYSVYMTKISEANKNGKIYLSVHPFDFLTVSENNHGWSSCHSLDGDYRDGNLNYMVDDCTLIAYFAGSEGFEAQLPNFPEGILWNSKKYRMLIHLKVSADGTVVLLNKEYPYQFKIGYNKIVEVLKKLYPELKDATPSSYNYEENGSPAIHKMVKRFSGYSDLSRGYATILSSVDEEEFSGRTLMTIGQRYLCLSCGDELASDEGSDGACENCSEACENITCSECGRRVLEEDAYYIDDRNDYICWHCYEELYSVCAICGETVLKEDITHIESLEIEVCSDCFNQNFGPSISTVNLGICSTNFVSTNLGLRLDSYRWVYNNIAEVPDRYSSEYSKMCSLGSSVFGFYHMMMNEKLAKESEQALIVRQASMNNAQNIFAPVTSASDSFIQAHCPGMYNDMRPLSYRDWLAGGQHTLYTGFVDSIEHDEIFKGATKINLFGYGTKNDFAKMKAELEERFNHNIEINILNEITITEDDVVEIGKVL